MNAQREGIEPQDYALKTHQAQCRSLMKPLCRRRGTNMLRRTEFAQDAFGMDAEARKGTECRHPVIIKGGRPKGQQGA